jgi:hypothetical protein
MISRAMIKQLIPFLHDRDPDCLLWPLRFGVDLLNCTRAIIVARGRRCHKESSLLARAVHGPTARRGTRLRQARAAVAVAGGFSIAMGVYWPKPAMLDESWAPPRVKRVN